MNDLINEFPKKGKLPSLLSPTMFSLIQMMCNLIFLLFSLHLIFWALALLWIPKQMPWLLYICLQFIVLFFLILHLWMLNFRYCSFFTLDSKHFQYHFLIFSISVPFFRFDLNISKVQLPCSFFQFQFVILLNPLP